MRDFYNGLFALGLVAGAGACVLVFILLEWFGFEISASSGFLAALLGAFVGGSFTIAAQMMAADAAAKEAKKERDEQSLKIEKAIARSILLKIHDYQNDTFLMGSHYSNRTQQNSHMLNEVPVLARIFRYTLCAFKFSIEEKSVCLEWKNDKLINGLNMLERHAVNLEILHRRYSEEIAAYSESENPIVHGRFARRYIENPSDDPKFQQLLAVLGQLKDEFNEVKIPLSNVRALIESEISARFSNHPSIHKPHKGGR